MSGYQNSSLEIKPLRLGFLLGGVPPEDTLDFSEDALTKLQKDTPFPNTFREKIDRPPEEELAQWRLLRGKARLRSGWSQPYLPAEGALQRMPVYSNSVVPEPDGILVVGGQTSILDDTILGRNDFDETSGFLEHSLTPHDTLLESQIPPETPGDSDDDDSASNFSSFLTQSFNDTTTFDARPSESQKRILQPSKGVISTLTPLANIPSARDIYFSRTEYTPSLLCVLTSDLVRRKVSHTKTGNLIDLYEITVADHTRRNFKVVFFLFPIHPFRRDKTQETLRMTLEEVKVGSILLIKFVRLSVFRDEVSGQNINLGMNKVRTEVLVLSKADGLPVYDGISDAGVEKQLAAVKKWAKLHVVSDNAASRKRNVEVEGLRRSPRKRVAMNYDDELPPDTMEESY